MSESSRRAKLDFGKMFREELRFTLRTFFAPLRGAVGAMRAQWHAIMAEAEDKPVRDPDRR